VKEIVSSRPEFMNAFKVLVNRANGLPLSRFSILMTIIAKSNIPIEINDFKKIIKGFKMSILEIKEIDSNHLTAISIALKQMLKMSYT
jgi:hypothetical protein